MSVQVRRRRESASFLASFVGAQGELIVDTTNNRVQVHDGTTPGGSPAAKLSEVVTNTRTAVADAAYAALTTDRTIAVASLTAARTIALPAASAYPTGTQLLVFDESGACSATNTITIARTGTDTINGATSTAISSAYGYLALESNGSGRWTVVDQTPTTTGAATRTPVADANYTALTTDRVIGYSSLTAARTVTLPSAAAFPVGTRLLVLDESGAASATNTITMARTGTDTINGTTIATIATAYGYLALQSNGSGKWTLVDQAPSAGGAVAPRSAVRQTVQGGPSASGPPSFLPAGSSSLSLSAQNVSASTPLTVSAAQGCNATGQNDLVYQFTSNPNWSGLPASSTVYLYINAATGATGTTTLVPVYQFGGAISTTSGQFTFDYQAMAGYVGNGSAAVATPLVFVGEAVTSVSAVTSTIAYAYNGYYESALTSSLPPLGGATTKTSNLGVIPKSAIFLIQNITADQGYSPGDQVQSVSGYASTGSVTAALVTIVSRNTVSIVGPQTSIVIFNKSNGTGVNPSSSAYWGYQLVARRGWGGA